MRKSDERGIALLLTLLVLTLLVALILEFDAEARREYRDAAAFRDNFKATVLARSHHPQFFDDQKERKPRS